MRRFLVATVTCLIVLVTAGLAWAATPSATVATSAETRVLQYYATGPSANCDGDSCGEGGVTPTIFTLPAAARSYRGTLTVSLTYVTHGAGEFAFVPRIERAAGPDVGAVTPAQRLLAPSDRPTSTTLVSQVTGLPGGRPLQFEAFARIASRSASPISITTSQVVVELRVSSS